MRTRVASGIVRLALAALLLPFALDWRSPLLASVRSLALAFFIIVPSALIIAGILALRPSARPLLRTLEWLALLTAALALVFAVTPEVRFHLLRHQVLDADAAALQKLGRHLIVGYRDIGELQELIRRGAIAGVFISATNVRGLSADGVGQQIAEMQEIRRDQHLPPLWIATDQEGGDVARLSPPLPRPPRISEILAHYQDRTHGIAAVRQSAREQGRALADLGVNLNFAPVVDVDHGLINPEDWFTHIHQRAISNDPAVVTAAAGAYCDGLRDAGVHCTLKHFPGLGRVLADTHRGAASLDVAVRELEQSDWVPFRALMERPDSFTMLGHVTLSELDRAHPVSFSQAAVTTLLRGDWHYGGVLVTDDFSMDAVYRSRDGIAEAAVAALNAGVDLVLVSYDTDQFYAVMHGLLAAQRDGRLQPEALRQSEERLSRPAGNLTDTHQSKPDGG
ncbi:MAG: glycoside hydrolase family 3 protein [Hyphomicrobiales bacterium]|nr:glycoside hydrolase family 3 protein [Hyphomicrobiales bacterium]MBV9427274.1 glycoside hydrolase family 3 protein [Bradyrhizobiaceae bacterium]